MAAAIPVIPPGLGGVHFEVAWTGGKPANVARTVSENVLPISPFCLRPIKPSDSLRVYEMLTSLPSNLVPFKRGDSLVNFERVIMQHMITTGCDSIAYQTTNRNPNVFVNIITEHASVTLAMVEDYWATRIANNEVDPYEMSNLRDFRVFFLSDGTTTGGVEGLSREEVQRAALATLGMCFAQVLTVDKMIQKIKAAAAVTI